MNNLSSKINFENIYYTLSILLAFAAPLSWKAFRLIVILLIVTKIIQFDYKTFFLEIKKSKLLIALLAFLVYQFITFLWTETTYNESYEFIRGLFLWFAIPILALSIKAHHIRHIITAFLFAMAISEFAAYGMYFGFWTINGHGAEYPSPFMYHTSYSIYMAFTAIILLNRLYSQLYNKKEKVIMAFFFMTITGNLFISQGRIGQLAFAFAILIAGLLHFKLRIKTFLISIVAISAIFFTAYHISPMFQKRVQMASKDISKIQEGDLYSSWGIRVAYLIMGTDIIKEHPLLGVGLEDYQSCST
jgi:O-antigen ligase